MDNYTTLQSLHEGGVHFVLCRAADDGNKKKKSAIASGWQTKAATLEAVLKHHAAGGLLGFIPGAPNCGYWTLTTHKTLTQSERGLARAPGKRLPSCSRNAALMSTSRKTAARFAIGNGLSAACRATCAATVAT